MGFVMNKHQCNYTPSTKLKRLTKNSSNNKNVKFRQMHATGAGKKWSIHKGSFFFFDIHVTDVVVNGESWLAIWWSKKTNKENEHEMDHFWR